MRAAAKLVEERRQAYKPALPLEAAKVVSVTSAGLGEPWR
jgi:hypothetical protein